MKTFQHIFEVKTPGRSLVEITTQVKAFVEQSGVQIGLCHVFLHHTSASLLICENSDPDVQRDLETFFSDLVPDGDLRYKHIAEGPDDMSSHVRSVLTTNALNFPITDARLALGTWQGIYLWEHRMRPYARRVTVTVQGT
ncbi:MAG: secondary thiamine-phosphate synthase enzyme YjbQ [Gammaproteobacteria bacterium]|nr:secondary thiamine-phosphate synthase enzyme YjbQ [Gammaproteobacteria bacterium]